MTDKYIYLFFVGILLPLIIFTVFISIKTIIEKSLSIKEIKQIEEKVETVKNYIDNTKPNVLQIMFESVSELSEYYVISKGQAIRTFTSSLFICFAGFIIYVCGIIILRDNLSLVIISAIAGTLVEIIAGLFFWLYKRAIDQLNLYHYRLSMTERYLIAIELINKLPDDKRMQKLEHIIECILIDNRLAQEKEDIFNIIKNHQ